MSMQPLSHFPDLCLLAIFKRIPLVDVIRNVSRVCRNWTRVGRDDLRQRKKLTIFKKKSDLERISDNPFGSDLIYQVHRDDGSPWATRMCSVKQTKFNAVSVPHRVLTESITTLLMDLLLNITHLTIVQNNISPNQSISILEQITRLIRHNAANLISLKLDFGYPKFNSATLDQIDIMRNQLEIKVLALIDSINRLKSLRHLTLNVNLENLNVATPQLNQLSCLATFATREFSPASLLLGFLPQLTSGVVRIEGDNYLDLSDLIELDPQLATRFSRIRIDHQLSVTDYGNTRLFCTRFNSLIILELSDCSMPLTMFAQCLSQLTHLVHLKLSFLFGIQEAEPQLELTQVSSVRLLTLTINTNSHLHTKRLHLHYIFPNLQVLHFTNHSTECVDCDYNYSFASERERAEFGPLFGHCLKLARQPFRQCAKLHTIKLNTNLGLLLLPQVLITVDQL